MSNSRLSVGGYPISSAARLGKDCCAAVADSHSKTAPHRLALESEIHILNLSPGICENAGTDSSVRYWRRDSMVWLEAERSHQTMTACTAGNYRISVSDPALLHLPKVPNPG
jgi:hypothetical protein